MRIEALAREHGVAVQLKPFLLGPIFKSLGWDTSPFVLQQRKGTYTWRDMERQCAKYGLAWTKPTSFPRRALLPTRIALLACDQSWVWDFCKRIMQANFVHDQEVDDPLLVSAILTELGLDADGLINDARGEAAKAALHQQSADANARGLFGAPSFLVGDELFWGNDRLDDAIALAALMKKGR
ncbi:MAG: 2-hydroxychromene-2-carboxylate isomerase, partial [Massilia sp.]